MRLIDADELKNEMDKILMPGKDAVLETYIDEIVCTVIDDAPTVEAAPVRRGKWDKNHICTACGKICITIKDTSGQVMYIETPYCPGCGAKMKGMPDVMEESMWSK